MRGRLAVLVIAAAFAGVALAWGWVRLWSHADVGGPTFFGGDLEAYRQGAIRLVESGTPYHAALEQGPIANVVGNVPIAYLYPPVLAQLLVPLRDAPPQALAMASSATQVALLGILLPLVYRRHAGRVDAAALAVIWMLALASFPLQFSVYGGNMSGWLAIAIALMLLGPGRTSGAAAAVSSVIKMTPAVLVVPALVERRTRRAAIGALVALVALSIALAPRAWTEWLRLLPNILQFPPGPEPLNMSASSVLASVGFEAGLLPGLIIAGVAITASALLAVRGAWAASVSAAVAALLLGPNSLWDHYLAIVAPVALAAWPNAGPWTRMTLVLVALLNVALWMPQTSLLARLTALGIVATALMASTVSLARRPDPTLPSVGLPHPMSVPPSG